MTRHKAILLGRAWSVACATAAIVAGLWAWLSREDGRP